MGGGERWPKNSRECLRLLGLHDAASPTEIRRAFRERALVLHPDRNPSPTAGREFQQVAEAYRRLRELGRLAPAARPRAKTYFGRPAAPTRQLRHPRYSLWIIGLPAAIALAVVLGNMTFSWSMEQLARPKNAGSGGASTWKDDYAESLAKGITAGFLAGGCLILLVHYLQEYQHRGVMRMKRRASARRHHRWSLGHCAHCDYDLTGNMSGTCPECGQYIGLI